MRTLHLISGKSFTGPAATALTDARALRAAGHDARLGGRTGSHIERACLSSDGPAAGVPFVGGLKLGRGLARILHLSRDARHLCDAASELKIDAVHTHRSEDLLLARWAFGKSSSVRRLFTLHRPMSRCSEGYLKRLARSAHAIACVHREQEAALRTLGARAAWIAPGVDTDLFRPLENEAARPFTFGLIGRWKENEDRGQRAFLELLAKLEMAQPWRAVLLGRGEGRAALEQSLAMHRARERITMEETGAAYASQVARVDLGLVLATGADGGSRPALELLACGVPVLLADRPGLRELAAPDIARVLSEAERDAWIAAMHLAIREPRRSSAAREHAVRTHALPVRGNALGELFSLVPLAQAPPDAT